MDERISGNPTIQTKTNMDIKKKTYFKGDTFEKNPSLLVSTLDFLALDDVP